MGDRVDLVGPDFFSRLAAFVAERMVVQDRLADLPKYEAAMGHRYAFAGRTEPLSIFQGEGLALYLFVKAFQPRVILDLFTGTGMAAAYLGAGNQFGLVYSVDNYSEGGEGATPDETAALRLAGWNSACDLIRACDLRNVKLVFGSHPQLLDALDADGVALDRVDMVVLDGGGKTVSTMFERPGVVLVTHDESGPLGPSDFRIVGGSYLTFSVPPAMLAMCYRVFSPYFLLEVADSVLWRPILAKETQACTT